MKALVLSGGGAKGSVQCGVLRGMLNNNPDLDYDIYTGISVGALNVSQLAAGPLRETLPELENVWLKEIKGNKSIWKHKLLPRLYAAGITILVLMLSTIITAFLSFKVTATILLVLFLCSFYLPYYILKKTRSIYNTDPLKRLLKKVFPATRLLHTSKQMKVGAVSYQDGNYYSADNKDPNILKWVLASSSFPVFFPMEVIDGVDYTDGGVREIAPVKDAIDMGATEIDIILTSVDDDSAGKVPGVLEQGMHFLDIMSSEIVKNDVKVCHEMGIKVRVIRPQIKIFKNSLDFDPKLIRANYEHGIEIGSKIFSN